MVACPAIGPCDGPACHARLLISAIFLSSADGCCCWPDDGVARSVTRLAATTISARASFDAGCVTGLFLVKIRRDSIVAGLASQPSGEPSTARAMIDNTRARFVAGRPVGRVLRISMTFDLILKGGRVIDPSQSLDR